MEGRDTMRIARVIARQGRTSIDRDESRYEG